MAHAHESNTERIWKVFWILSVITIVEVILGIYKPACFTLNKFFRNKSFKLDIHYFNIAKGIWYYMGIYAHGR